ncbi:MAG TPA: hypothetical protein VM888_11145 [Chitinophagaceae bacterium]|nr:hypothetical protein [Chitinophagaceae bacterium]
MENIILMITGSLLYSFSTTPKRKNRCRVGDTKCTVSQFTKNDKFIKSVNKKGDVMHFCETGNNTATFGIITMQLKKKPATANKSKILGDFINSLHSSLNIKHHVGLSYGYSQKGNNQVIGMEDYWQDEKGMDWKVKGWTDGRTYGFLFVKNISAISSVETDAYLDSFRFAAR